MIPTTGGGSSVAPTPEEVAWAAGLWAGEGTAGGYYYASRGRGIKRIAQLQMNDEWELREFTRIVGVGAVYPYNPPSRQARGHAAGWQWQVQSRAAVEQVYNLLGPYLSDRRCLQFERALA